jgi:carbamoyl-phosphate synthase large subunit
VTISVNVLISSAGRRVVLLDEFREALRSLSLDGAVLAADMSSLSAAFHRADQGFVVPPCRDDAFVPSMLSICAQERVGLVIPTIDTELDVFARHRDRFAAAGTTVAVSSPDVVAIGSDKAATNLWLRQEGFPAVRQAPAHELLADPSAWRYPLIVKPRAGSASVGVRRVDSPDELTHTPLDDDFLVEELAMGDEHTVDVLMSRAGRALSVVLRRRMEVRAGEVSKAIIVRDERIEQLAATICEALPGAFGALTLQLFVDPADRSIRVIELNPRFGGGFPLSWEAGARFPKWLIEEVAGLPSTVSSKVREGLVMLRYDDAVFLDREQVGL